MTKPHPRLRVTRPKVFIGDLRHPIDVQRRTLQSPTPGQWQPSEGFQTIFSPWSAVQDVNGVRQFDGINILDEATHVFVILYREDHKDIIEINNTFILFESKRYKVLRVTDKEEDHEYLVIQATERGDSIKNGSEA